MHGPIGPFSELPGQVPALWFMDLSLENIGQDLWQVRDPYQASPGRLWGLRINVPSFPAPSLSTQVKPQKLPHYQDPQSYLLASATPMSGALFQGPKIYSPSVKDNEAF